MPNHLNPEMDNTEGDLSGGFGASVPVLKASLASGGVRPRKADPSPSIAEKLMGLVNTLNGINSGPSGIDKSLKVLCYSLSFMSNFLPIPPAGSASASASPSVLASGLGSISSHISMCRYVLRIVTGIPSSVEGTVNNSWLNGPTKLPPSPSGAPRSSECTNSFVNALESTMPTSMLAYYPLEHVAYCAWLAPKLFTSEETVVGRLFNGFKSVLQPDVGDWFSAASCYAWFWYIIADIVVQGERILRLGSAVKKLEQEEKEGGFRAGDDEERAAIVDNVKNDLFNAKLTFAREVIYVVPCLHWMNPYYATQPLMSKKKISVFMATEALLSFYQGWVAQKRKEKSSAK